MRHVWRISREMWLEQRIHPGKHVRKALEGAFPSRTSTDGGLEAWQGLSELALIRSVCIPGRW